MILVHGEQGYSYLVYNSVVKLFSYFLVFFNVFCIYIFSEICGYNLLKYSKK